MAKIKKTIIQVSGKLDGVEHVQSNRYPPHTRIPREKTSKLQYETLESNFRYNTPVNSLAGDINRYIHDHTPYMHQTDLYSRLLSFFKEYKTDNRYIMLQSIMNMEIKTGYPIEQLGRFQLNVQQEADRIVINLKVMDHPRVYKWDEYNSDCHSFEFILLCWKKNEKATWHIKGTEWIDSEGPFYRYKIPIDVPAETDHWLLLVRHVAGQDKVPLETIRAERMAFGGCGTYVEADSAAYEKYLLEQQQARESGSGRRKEADIERVGPEPDDE